MLDKDHIRELIANDELRETIDYIKEHTADSKVKDEIALLSARLKGIESKSRLGVLSAEEVSRSKAQIRMALLAIEDPPHTPIKPPLPPSTKPITSSNPPFWIRLLLGVLLFIGVISLGILIGNYFNSEQKILPQNEEATNPIETSPVIKERINSDDIVDISDSKREQEDNTIIPPIVEVSKPPKKKPTKEDNAKSNRKNNGQIIEQPKEQKLVKIAVNIIGNKELTNRKLAIITDKEGKEIYSDLLVNNSKKFSIQVPKKHVGASVKFLIDDKIVKTQALISPVNIEIAELATITLNIVSNKELINKKLAIITDKEGKEIYNDLLIDNSKNFSIKIPKKYLNTVVVFLIDDKPVKTQALATQQQIIYR